MEERRIWTSTELCGYLDFPYVAQVFVIQRIIVRLTTEERCCETVYGVTSCRPEKASPACLLAWNRNHWCISGCWCGLALRMRIQYNCSFGLHATIEL